MSNSVLLVWSNSIHCSSLIVYYPLFVLFFFWFQFYFFCYVANSFSCHFFCSGFCICSIDCFAQAIDSSFLQIVFKLSWCLRGIFIFIIERLFSLGYILFGLLLLTLIKSCTWFYLSASIWFFCNCFLLLVTNWHW